MNLIGLALSAALLRWAPQTIPIREAIKLIPRGDIVIETNKVVSVTGVVTVPSARTDSSLGVFVQDRTAGIRLYQYDYNGPALFVGDSIAVTGKLGIYYGQEEIVSPSIRILRRRTIVQPVSATLEQVADGVYHGLLVRCTGKIIGSVFRSDGVLIHFVNRKNDTASAFVDFRRDPQFDPRQIRIGDSYDITGISTRFSLRKPYTNNDDILIRSSADLLPLHETILERYSRLISLVIAVVILLIASLAGFAYMLRRKVRQKTLQLEDQNRILRLFFDSIADLTGVLDRKKILTLMLRRAHSIAGTGAVVFAEATPPNGGILMTALKMSGDRLLTETQRFESNTLSHVFDQLSERGALWNTTVEEILSDTSVMEDRSSVRNFLNVHLADGNISIVAPNPASREFLVIFNHPGPISQRLPRALIISYIMHVYSAYRSADLFDVVKKQGASLETLYNNSVFGLMTFSEGGVIHTANKIAMQMFDDDNIKGKHIRDYLVPEDASRLDDLLQSLAAASEERFVRFSAGIKGLSGRRNFEFALQFDPGSMIFYTTVQDTSDREYYENYATNEKKIETLERLASSLTHDLNNIVGSITGYASLLKRKLPQNSKEHHYADIIENSSRRTTGLVKEVLGFSQLDAKTLEVVDLNGFCTDIVSEFRKTHGNMYSILITPSQRPVYSRISTSQLRQVLFALLTNAAESMENGGTIKCTVGVGVIPKSAPAYLGKGEHCFVEIEDHGLGMDDAIKRRIFEPFFTTKRVKKYTGLSLSMAYNIVKHHKGFIEVDSTPSIGTRVRIFLARFSEKGASREESTMTNAVEPKGMKVLVVDDEDGVRQLGYDILTEHGYSVMTANDGLQALKCLEQNPDVSLVVLDMVMPGMGGKDTCLEIKKKPGAPKVLICTGYSELADLETILGKFADGFLPKPYSTGEMTRIVDQLLSASSS